MSYARCLACTQTTLPILRGGAAFCSSCGAPVAAPGLSVAGSPARFGGQVASLLSWALVALALMLGGTTSLLVSSLFDAGPLWTVMSGLLVTLPLLTLGLLLRVGAKKLVHAGARSREEAQLRTVWDLASAHQGRLTPVAAARGLGCTTEEADALLTDLARKGEARLEVDHEGQLVYLFGDALLASPPPASALRTRVAPSGGFPGGHDGATGDELHPSENVRSRGTR